MFIFRLLECLKDKFNARNPYSKYLASHFTYKEDDSFLETLGRRGDLLGGLSLMGVVTVVGVTGGTVMGVV